MRKDFLLGGAVLLAGLSGLAIVDNARPWRRLQLEFFDLERQALREQLAAARARAGEAADELSGSIEEARQQLRERGEEVIRLETELRGFRAKLRAAERRQEAARFDFEEAHYRARRAGEEPDEIEPLSQQLLETRIEIEGVRKLVAEHEERLRELRSDPRSAEERRESHFAPVEALERRLRELERGSFFRRLPVAGQFHPSVTVREISPGVGSARVDRCTPCHLAADRAAGFEGDRWPIHLRSHPRPDLVGDGSPHPIERFGCTACHGGEGRATGFESAGHRPATAEQTAEWAARWGPETSSDRPIRPLTLVESGCGGCHGDEVWITAAPTLDAGLELFVRLGCVGCHDAGQSGTEKTDTETTGSEKPAPKMPWRKVARNPDRP